MAANYSISRPVPYHTDPEFDHAVTFAVDKRDNALIFHPSASGGNVVWVGEDSSPWTPVAEQADAQILSSAFPNSSLALQGQAALIRSALRGEGRARDRR
jgi:hypothetical protein